MALTDPVYIARRKKVLDQIAAHPETHSQMVWENGCGTVRCVAGWAIHNELPEGAPIRWIFDIKGYERAGYAIVAADLLGLGYYEAEELFRDANDDEAVNLLEQYVQRPADVQHLPGYGESNE